jgi:hypothetical protein
MTLGWIPTMFIGLIVFALVFISVSPIVDELIPIYNDLNTDIPHSMTANWTMSGLIALFGAESIMTLITFGISGYINSVQSRDGGVMGGTNTGISVLQATVVSLLGILSLIVIMFCIVPVVDLFTDFATTLEITDPTMLLSMSKVIAFSDYTYWIVFLIGVVFFLTPLFSLWAIHSYTSESTQIMQEEGNY